MRSGLSKNSTLYIMLGWHRKIEPLFAAGQEDFKVLDHKCMMNVKILINPPLRPWL